MGQAQSKRILKMNSTELEFEFHDRYSAMIWNPQLLNDSTVKALKAEFFFNIIFSVFRDKNHSNKKVSESATELLSKLNKDITAIHDDFHVKLREINFCISECPFTVTFNNNEAINVILKTENNSGVCPDNAIFLKTFLLFDQLVSALGKARSISLITDKDYFTQRKNAQSTIRNLMEMFNIEVKRFHASKKVKIHNN